MTEDDLYDYRPAADGSYIITKNGEPFLTCTGTAEDAQDLVDLLRNDVVRQGASK